MLGFVPARKLTNFIGRVYYDIVPINYRLLKTTLILLREMLSFSLKDASTVREYLKMTGQEETPFL